MAEETLYLAHHGIKGQKWGLRRWQNADGSLTPAGYAHYGRQIRGAAKKAIKTGSKESMNDFKKQSKDFIDKHGFYDYRKLAFKDRNSRVNDFLRKYGMNDRLKTPVEDLMLKTGSKIQWDNIPYNPKKTNLFDRYPGIYSDEGNAKLYKHIIDKSIDLYNGVPASDEAKKWWKTRQKLGNSRENLKSIQKHNAKLPGIVLNDLGVDNTPESRKAMAEYLDIMYS